MTPGRWAEMKELFSAAKEKPPGGREAFLQGICPDAAVRDDVRKLLEADDRGALQSPVGSMLARPVLPALVGRYRIVRLVGEGGMGTVYEAEQDQPRRRVAIKAIRAGLANPALLRRFEHEAQALARLQHPGIAQIYETGTADSGFGPQPYFAMEFIDGAPLLRYAGERRLGVRQRLELMALVCDAVQHAHQRGIIHRDLKPGNILVDEAGQPKIVDFGVARATDADAQATRDSTFGQLLGTLTYMSPEQVLGDPQELDTRSDVYALGVILYELLAGRLPYETSGQLPVVVQRIREEDPAPLSSINRTCRGDIETIVGKALEKDKARRYSSAAELAADIRRYLKDEPIMARPSTATYHLRKFARRHSGLVAGVVVAFVLLIAGIAASTREAGRALRAEAEALRQRDSAAAAQQAAHNDRDRAVSAEQTLRIERDRAVKAEQAAMVERNRALAEKRHADTESATAAAISDFLRHDLLSQASAISLSRSGERPGPDLKVRTALDRAAASIAGRFDKQPLVEAAIRHTIGDAYWGMGIYPEARAQAVRALELRRRALGDEHPDTLETTILLARVYREEGKYTDAEPLLTRAVEVMRRKLGESNPDTLTAMSDLATLYRLQNKLAQAEPIAERVLEQRRRVLGPEHIHTLESTGNLGVLYAEQSKYAQAEPLFTQTVEAFRRLRGEEDPETVVSMLSLAALYVVETKYGLAEPILAKSVPAAERVLGAEDPHTLSGMSTLARVYSNTGRYAEAETLSVKVLEMRRRVSGAEHPETLTAMNNLAALYSRQAKYDVSAPLLAQVLDTRRRVYGEDNRTTLNARYNLAVADSGLGKLDAAEKLLRENLAAARRLLGDRHPETLTNIAKLASICGQEGKYAEAESLCRPAVEASKSVRGPEHPDTLATLIILAGLYQEQGKFSEADPILTQALETSRRTLGPAHATTRNCAVSLAKVRLQQGKYTEAEALLRGSLDARDDEGPYSWQPFDRRSLLGLSLMEQSKFAEAEPLLVAGYRGLAQRKAVLPATVSLWRAGERIIQLYTNWGRPERAAEWRKEVQPAEPPAPDRKN